MSGPVDRAPIEERLAAAGLPPLPRMAWLEISLDALAGNLAALRLAAGPGVAVEPVVKADAYGHGAIPVARALQTAGADGLSVATLDEALELRAAGIVLPVLVLYPVPAAWVAEAAARSIAVSLGSGAATARILAAAASLPSGTPALAVHLEVETGLGRGGVLPEAAAETVSLIRRSRGVRLAGIWTHLSAADNPHLTLLQDERFGGAVAPLAGTADPDAAVRRHLAGSGGLLGADARRWDAIRAGLSTYGLIPDGLAVPQATSAAASGLRPVMRLCARPVRVMELPTGHGVSYGTAFTTERPSRIATLPLGYADGWHRALSNRAEALVRGVRVPLVGRVAMDAVMADVTDVPGAPVTEDDEFVLIGEQGAERITAHEIASAGGTISYEVVAGMSRRMPRVYDAAGLAVVVRTLMDSVS